MRRIHRLLLTTSLAGALAACGGGGGTNGTDGTDGAAAGTGATAGTSGSGSSGATAGTSGTSAGTAGTSAGSAGGTAGSGSSGSGSGTGTGTGSGTGTGTGTSAGTTGGTGSGTTGTGTAGSTAGTGSAGGSGSTGAGGSTGSGAATPLTLSASVPAANDGVIDTALAVQAMNEARAADGAIPTPYCALTFQIAPSSNTKKYNVTVYFRQSDAKVLHAGIVDGLGLWIVSDTDTINGIDRVSVDVPGRTVRFTQKSLVGGPDPLQPLPLVPNQSTIADGSFGFPVNGSAVAACGV